MAAAVLTAYGGPVEFGLREFESAAAERRLRPAAVRIATEISSAPPGSYRILPGRIEGGDLRGLMYGLLAAAAQIRAAGRLAQEKGAPATAVRGLRYVLEDPDSPPEWFYSQDYWLGCIRMLARCRFNRLHLALVQPPGGLNPARPLRFALPEFPQLFWPAPGPESSRRDLAMLRLISSACAEHGIDFTLGIWERGPQTGSNAEGLSAALAGPYFQAALRRLLAECPMIRRVQIRAGARPPAAGSYAAQAFRAVAEAGRRVVLEVEEPFYRAAQAGDVPVRLIKEYWTGFLQYPDPHGEAPGAGEILWDIRRQGPNPAFFWGDPALVRRVASALAHSRTEGFEIELPAGPPGPANWFALLLWGRLSYDPQTQPKVWENEVRRRFGLAAPAVLEAFRLASRICQESQQEAGDRRARESQARQRLALAQTLEEVLARTRARAMMHNQEWEALEAGFRAVARLAR